MRVLFSKSFPFFRLRRDVGFMPVCFVGAFSSGKTYSVVRLALQDPHRHIAVHHSFGQIIVPKGWRVTYLSDYSQAVELEKCTLIIDEAAIFFSSRERANIDVPLRAWLKQARKYRVRVIYAEQHFSSLAKEMRQYFEVVIKCERWQLPWFGSEYRAPVLCCDTCQSFQADKSGDWPLFRTFFVHKWYSADILEDAASVFGVSKRQLKAGEKSGLDRRPIRSMLIPYSSAIAKAYNTDNRMTHEQR